MFKKTRKKIFSLIFPAPKFFYYNISSDGAVNVSEEYAYFCNVTEKFDNFNLVTPKGELQGKFISLNLKFGQSLLADAKTDKSLHNHKVIIMVGANAECAESTLLYGMDCYKSAVANDELSLLSFNHYGVGRSTGECCGPQDLYQGLEKIIQHLEKNGIQASNIILHGRSLGAAVATEVAWRMAYKNRPVNLIADRTFSSLSLEVISLFGLIIPIVGHVLGALLVPLFFLLNFSMPTKTRFSQLQKKVGVERNLAFNVYDDKIIPKTAGLAFNLANKTNTYVFTTNNKDAHNCGLIDLCGMSNKKLATLVCLDFYYKNFPQN